MDRFLARMHGRGKSLTWIAKALGVARPMCVARAEALGLVRRRARRLTGAVCDAPEPSPIGPAGELLEAGVCHWVAGSVALRAWRMCGHPSVHGTPWCRHHLSRVLLKVRERG